jgi:5-methyltetrahydrofolate--homocysteine methyltransferase
LRNELKLNTTCGASNFSFGLPNRNGVNGTFIAMAIGAGMTSAIVNPMHSEVTQAVFCADVVLGHDPNCANWLRRYRPPTPQSEEGDRRERRRRNK